MFRSTPNITVRLLSCAQFSRKLNVHVDFSDGLSDDCDELRFKVKVDL